MKSFRIAAVILALCLCFPLASSAELQIMSEADLKSISLSDFVRPMNAMILQSDTMDFDELESVVEADRIEAEPLILIDAERLIEDLMAQYESIQNGNGPIEGIYPYTEDPSYLIKQ